MKATKKDNNRIVCSEQYRTPTFRLKWLLTFEDGTLLKVSRTFFDRPSLPTRKRKQP